MNQEVPQPNQPLPTDMPRKCGTCNHWHPPIMPCAAAPRFPTQTDMLRAIIDQGCEINLLHQIAQNFSWQLAYLMEKFEVDEQDFVQWAQQRMAQEAARASIVVPEGVVHGRPE